MHAKNLAGAFLLLLVVCLVGGCAAPRKGHFPNENVKDTWATVDVATAGDQTQDEADDVTRRLPPQDVIVRVGDGFESPDGLASALPLNASPVFNDGVVADCGDVTTTVFSCTGKSDGSACAALCHTSGHCIGGNCIPVGPPIPTWDIAISDACLGLPAAQKCRFDGLPTILPDGGAVVGHAGISIDKQRITRVTGSGTVAWSVEILAAKVRILGGTLQGETGWCSGDRCGTIKMDGTIQDWPRPPGCMFAFGNAGWTEVCWPQQAKEGQITTVVVRLRDVEGEVLWSRSVLNVGWPEFYPGGNPAVTVLTAHAPFGGRACWSIEYRTYPSAATAATAETVCMGSDGLKSQIISGFGGEVFSFGGIFDGSLIMLDSAVCVDCHVRWNTNGSVLALRANTAPHWYGSPRKAKFGCGYGGISDGLTSNILNQKIVTAWIADDDGQPMLERVVTPPLPGLMTDIGYSNLDGSMVLIYEFGSPKELHVARLDPWGRLGCDTDACAGAYRAGDGCDDGNPITVDLCLQKSGCLHLKQP